MSNNIMKFTQFDNEYVTQVWERMISASREEDQQAASQAVLNNPSRAELCKFPIMYQQQNPKDMAQRGLNLCQLMLDKKKESKDNNTYSIIEKSDSE